MHVAALKFLEQGRGMLVASLRDLRRDTFDLQQNHPKLTKQFIRFRDELDQPVEGVEPLLQTYHWPAWHHHANRRYETANKLEDVIIEIRQRSGFDDFFVASTTVDTLNAVRCGSLVVVIFI